MKQMFLHLSLLITTTTVLFPPHLSFAKKDIIVISLELWCDTGLQNWKNQSVFGDIQECNAYHHRLTEYQHQERIEGIEMKLVVCSTILMSDVLLFFPFHSVNSRIKMLLRFKGFYVKLLTKDAMIYELSRGMSRSFSLFSFSLFFSREMLPFIL